MQRKLKIVQGSNERNSLAAAREIFGDNLIQGVHSKLYRASPSPPVNREWVQIPTFSFAAPIAEMVKKKSMEKPEAAIERFRHTPSKLM
jgi:hypothetical protein